MRKRDYKELIGKKINNLTVIGLGDRFRSGSRTLGTIRCKCDCGNEKDIQSGWLLSGKIKSCGRRERADG